jgi:integrase
LRHLARFILIGLYTGTRSAAISSASPYRDKGRSFVDLEAGIFYRLAEGQRITNKRQPPVPLPPRLLAHLRRWQSMGLFKTFFVEWNGEKTASVKTAFASADRLAGLDESQGRITPHVLRHTAATWLMQAGVDRWEAAGFLGMSVELIEKVYGHHHPDHLSKAAGAIGKKPPPRVPLVESLVKRNAAVRTAVQALENAGGPGRTRTCNQTVMSGRL